MTESNSTTNKKTLLKFSLIKKTFFYTLLFGFIAFCFFSLPLVFGFGKTGKNTQILGKDYSLLSKSEIISRLKSDFPLPETITIQNPPRTFTIKLNTIGANIDYDRLASDLLFRRLKSGVLQYFQAFFEPKNFSLEVLIREDELDKQLADIAQQVDRPFVPSQLYLEDKSSTITIKSGELGQKVNLKELKDQVISSLNYYQISTPINLPLDPVGQLPSEEQITRAKASAQNLIGKALEYSTPDQTVTLDDNTLISWIDFSNTCRGSAVTDYVVSLKSSLKKEPIEPVFKFENGQVLEFKPSQNGYLLDDSGLTQQICSNIVELTQTAEKVIKNKFPVITLEAKTENSDVNNFGIKELLGSGTSTFKHSTAIRNMNVERGASIVNRILVAPGETFSFVKALGDVSVENGYKMAYVIRAGKTELDVGGGICQVSTTFFRALLNSGLNITNRQNHAYRVQYYEEDMPPGYDATVFIPNPDLKFVNDTGHHILIQSKYDGKEKRLTYDIYGTSDGRKTEISNYRQWGAAPAPPTVYIDDPTLAPGKVIQDEHAIPGLKTSFDWKVTRDGQIIHQKTFSSSYSPWAAVFRRGPQI
ncbi:MAG: VanW family protein [Candidatus Shapirobacteria bacterium]|jgi:vancomycin resistance protein YoaR